MMGHMEKVWSTGEANLVEVRSDLRHNDGQGAMFGIFVSCDRGSTVFPYPTKRSDFYSCKRHPNLHETPAEKKAHQTQIVSCITVRANYRLRIKHSRQDAQTKKETAKCEEASTRMLRFRRRR
ncbi:hypothetical protein RvY_15259-2 [Ramazzottius varieornatus]|uniref:Uncharacterized protein n=1 Tax=Ramazzottius varieornatus TaxID=947166 RepID=A0A1D1VVW6_RAMVA|nr:hypothetical protein RvY_15259-2 [Ramazzottius varieornatus]